MGKERINKKVLYMSELGILIAILLLMAFTPVGYLKIGTMTITFLTIPVVVGAIVCGPGAGAILGTVFGLTSFYQCFGMDPMGTALMQISLPRTFAFTVIPRLLMGLLVGLVFKAFRKRTAAAYTVTAFCGPFFNTVLFMTVLIAVCSWIQIPAAVPFTLQTFAVFVTLGLLGGKRGTLAILVYILLGAVGVPVFAGFTGIRCGYDEFNRQICAIVQVVILPQSTMTAGLNRKW